MESVFSSTVSHSIKAELYFLILHFLQGEIPKASEQFQQILHDLESHLIQNSLLPKRLSWNSTESSSLSLAEMVNRNPNIESNHLLQIMNNYRELYGKLHHAQQSMSSLLGPTQHPPKPGSFLVSPRTAAFYKKNSNYNVILKRGIGMNVLSRDFSRKHIFSHFDKVKTFTGHVSASFCLAFDKTGKLLITGGDDGLLKVWHTSDARLIRSLRGHQFQISDLTLSDDNFVLVSSSLDGTIRAWDLRNGYPLDVLNQTCGVSAVEWVSASIDSDSILISTGNDGNVRLWIWRGKTKTFDRNPYLVPCKSLNKDTIDCVGTSSGNTRFVTGGTDGIIRLFTIPKIESLNEQSWNNPISAPSRIEFDVHNGSISCLHFSPVGLQFISGSLDGTARIWYHDKDPNNQSGCFMWKNRLLRAEDALNEKITLVLWTLLDDIVATVATDFQIRLWSANNARCVHVLNGHADEVVILIPHPFFEEILLSGSTDGVVILWNMIAGEKIKEIKMLGCKFLEGQWSPDGSLVAISDENGSTHLLSLSQNDSSYALTPWQQFFAIDFHDIYVDSRGVAIDSVENTPMHLCNRSPSLTEQEVGNLNQVSLDYATDIDISLDPDLRCLELKVVEENRIIENEILEIEEIQAVVNAESPKLLKRKNRKNFISSALNNSNLQPIMQTSLSAAAPLTSPLITLNSINSNVEDSSALIFHSDDDEEFHLSESESNSSNEEDASMEDDDENESEDESSDRGIITRSRSRRRSVYNSSRRPTVALRPRRSLRLRSSMAIVGSSSEEGNFTEEEHEDEDEKDTFGIVNDEEDEKESVLSEPMQLTTTDITPYLPSELISQTHSMLFPYHPQIEDIVAYFNSKDICICSIINISWRIGPPSWAVLRLKPLTKRQLKDYLDFHNDRLNSFNFNNLNTFHLNEIECEYHCGDDFIVLLDTLLQFNTNSHLKEFKRRETVIVHNSVEGTVRDIVVTPFSYKSILVKTEDETKHYSPWEISKLEDLHSPELSRVGAAFFKEVADKMNVVLQDNIAVDFVNHVDFSIFTDYLLVVPYPMSLLLIQQRLKHSFYRHKAALLYDVNLILSNCLSYNCRGSEIVSNARKTVSLMNGSINGAFMASNPSLCFEPYENMESKPEEELLVIESELNPPSEDSVVVDFDDDDDNSQFLHSYSLRRKRKVHYSSEESVNDEKHDGDGDNENVFNDKRKKRHSEKPTIIRIPNISYEPLSMRRGRRSLPKVSYVEEDINDFI